MVTDAPMVPVSWGELIDKITILEIKRARLRDPNAVANAVRELAALSEAAAVLDPEPIDLAGARAALTAVNTALWDIEDAIREHEAKGDFGPDFVALARSVYQQNDERGRIKRAINVMLGSGFVEEKQYAAY
jgi:hypothetical protein